MNRVYKIRKFRTSTLHVDEKFDTDHILRSIVELNMEFIPVSEDANFPEVDKYTINTKESIKCAQITLPQKNPCQIIM